MSQTSVELYGKAGFAGQIYDTMFTDKMSYSAEGAVPFGAIVRLGTNKERQVAAVGTGAGQAALAIGVAVMTYATEQDASGNVGYGNTQTVSVMKRGRIWVKTNDAVVAGAAANLNLSNGTVTDEAVAAGIEAFTNFSAKFITGTTAAGLAVVEINPK
jgi:hypothetical protein